MAKKLVFPAAFFYRAEPSLEERLTKPPPSHPEGTMKRNAQLLALMLGLGIAGGASAQTVMEWMTLAVRTQKAVGPEADIIRKIAAVRTQKTVGPEADIIRKIVAVRTQKTVGPEADIIRKIVAARTQKTVGPEADIIRKIAAVRTQKTVGPDPAGIIGKIAAVRTQKTVGPMEIIRKIAAVRTQKTVGPAIMNAVKTEKIVSQDKECAGRSTPLDLNAGF